MAPTQARGTAFTDVAVPLPRLAVGPQTFTIDGAATAKGVALADRLVRTFGVVRSRSTALAVDFAP